eukprot:TRINITY_DN3356_c0_g1_i1.p1 TRINITY_DN3356_c0_g1~~TRINITY_DN3356_c0_g1_i1.p1  ORF type:complete len:236 (+),score=48.04 TRINITY_DN3356_c0_g1_i1:109-816(+)
MSTSFGRIFVPFNIVAGGFALMGVGTGYFNKHELFEPEHQGATKRFNCTRFDNSMRLRDRRLYYEDVANRHEAGETLSLMDEARALEHKRKQTRTIEPIRLGLFETASPSLDELFAATDGTFPKHKIKVYEETQEKLKHIEGLRQEYKELSAAGDAEASSKLAEFKDELEKLKNENENYFLHEGKWLPGLSETAYTADGAVDAAGYTAPNQYSERAKKYTSTPEAEASRINPRPH